MDSNLREGVLRRVRSEIIAGEVPPGTMYSVPTLAAAMGVSSTPAREALLELARTGLLEAVRNRGFRVKGPTLQELRNLFDMRELLEVHAARLAAASKGKDLAPLRRLADDIARSVEQEDIELYLENDRAFHAILLSASGNTLLAETAMALRDTMRLYGIRSRAGRDRQAASVVEHHDIIDLAEAGEGDRLGELLRGHIRAWEPIFIEALSQTRDRSLPRSTSIRA